MRIHVQLHKSYQVSHGNNNPKTDNTSNLCRFGLQRSSRLLKDRRILVTKGARNRLEMVAAFLYKTYLDQTENGHVCNRDERTEMSILYPR